MDTYGHQMLPRALLEMNVLKMPHQMLPRCLPDASKSFPDASSDASQMPPRALLEMNALRNERSQDFKTNPVWVLSLGSCSVGGAGANDEESFWLKPMPCCLA